MLTADVRDGNTGVLKNPTMRSLSKVRRKPSTVLRTNSAQIRKRLKDEDLIAEDVMVGKVSRTPCSIMYIKDVANEALVAEVRRRLEGIRVDYLLDAELWSGS